MATKSFLKYTDALLVKAGSPVVLQLKGHIFFCQAITGAATVSFDSQQNNLPIFTKLGYSMTGNEQYREITIEATGGADATVSFFTGSMGIISGDTGGGSGSTQTIEGAVDDPNVGAVVPDDPTQPALYYKDQAVPIQFWIWSTSQNKWLAAITA